MFANVSGGMPAPRRVPYECGHKPRQHVPSGVVRRLERDGRMPEATEGFGGVGERGQIRVEEKTNACVAHKDVVGDRRATLCTGRHARPAGKTVTRRRRKMRGPRTRNLRRVAVKRIDYNGVPDGRTENKPEKSHEPWGGGRQTIENTGYRGRTKTRWKNEKVRKLCRFPSTRRSVRVGVRAWCKRRKNSITAVRIPPNSLGIRCSFFSCMLTDFPCLLRLDEFLSFRNKSIFVVLPAGIRSVRSRSTIYQHERGKYFRTHARKIEFRHVVR